MNDDALAAFREGFNEASRRAAEERKRLLEEAWKPDPADTAFRAAMLTYMQTGEIEPLLAALPPSPQSLRELILYMHEQTHPLSGAPGGKYLARWGRANYVAAELAGLRIWEWKSERARKRRKSPDEWILAEEQHIPDAVRRKIVDEVIEEMKGWDRTKRRLWADGMPNEDRVLELLRLEYGSRSFVEPQFLSRRKH
jgi:hypothetical protein